MSHPVIRLYSTATSATKAASELRALGYESVHLFAAAKGKSVTTAAGRKALVSSMMAAHILKSHAEVYAASVAKGKSLVLVHAPFGMGLKANQVLDSHKPSESGIADSYADSNFEWDDAAPLSSALCIPVLLRDRLPAQTISGIPSLTKGKAFLSDLLGMPLLSAGLTGRTSSMGLPLLSKSSTPLSSLFGMRTLSKSATPLSSLFGMPTLTKRQ